MLILSVAVCSHAVNAVKPISTTTATAISFLKNHLPKHLLILPSIIYNGNIHHILNPNVKFMKPLDEKRGIHTPSDEQTPLFLSSIYFIPYVPKNDGQKWPQRS